MHQIMREKKEVKTLRPSTERRPLRMHSFSPVPSTMTSYSSSMASEKAREIKRVERTRNEERVIGQECENDGANEGDALLR